MPTKIINAQIITLNDENDIYKHGSLVYHEGVIVEIAANDDNTLVCDRVIDAKNKVLLPGLINTHTHTPMTLLKGYAEDYSLEDWLLRVWPLEKNLTREEIALGSELAIIEMLLNGITTFSDLYIQIDAIAEKVASSGIRAMLARSVIEDPHSEQASRSKLDEAVANVKELSSTADGRIRMALAPHSIYTCSTAYLKEILEEAKSLDVLLQIHLAESIQERAYAKTNFGMSPVQYLASLDYFEHDILLAHAVHVDATDIDLLVQAGARIAHNPTSNLKLGNGIAPVSEFLKRGLTVGLGTDGAASNNRLDILAEIRLAALLQKGLTNDPTVLDALTGLKLGTIYGARALGLDQQIGSLEVGKLADFILVDIDKPNLSPYHDLVANLVYAASSADITDVFIAGREIVRNRELLTIDVERTREMITKFYNKMYN